jgi:hypothetical protein
MVDLRSDTVPMVSLAEARSTAGGSLALAAPAWP